MKVAIVNRFFHRAGAVPSVAREWAEQLEAAGHEVFVFASDVNAADSAARRTYVPVRLGRIKAFDLAGFAFARRLSAALRRVPDKRPDVILCVDSTAYFGAWYAGKRLRVPSIMIFQGWIYDPARRDMYPRTIRWAYKLSVHLCSRWAPLIGCLNYQIHDGLRTLGTLHDRLWLAPNCIDLKLWPSAKEGAHPREERRLLFVGRLSREKGLPFLLEAMPAVLEKHPNVRLLLLGGTEAQYGEYHEMARRLGIADHVEFGGLVPREAMPGIYADADLMVFPSLGEGHPLSLLECLACGTPVVGTSVPGLRQTVQEGINGFLVHAADAPALAAGICKVLADPRLLDRMTRAARPSVERFSWDHRIKEFEALVPNLKP